MHDVPMDKRIVYGANCTWWDSIHNAGTRVSKSKSGIPCCPYCGSVLFEVEDEEQFFSGVDEYAKNGHPGYRKILKWARGKCFKKWEQVEAAYNKSEEI